MVQPRLDRRPFNLSAVSLQTLSSVVLAVDLAISDQVLRICSSVFINPAFWASGTFDVTHASYFFRKSSQAATPVVWALTTPMLSKVSANAPTVTGAARIISLLPYCSA